jgi:hypothetical protein
MSARSAPRLSLAKWAVAAAGAHLAPAVMRCVHLLGRAVAEASAMALVTPPPPERPEETRGHHA